MIMSRLTPLLLCLCLIQIADAQSILSRVTFPINESQPLQKLAKAGIDLSHGDMSVRNSFTTELETYELKRLTDLGIEYVIKVENVAKDRLEGHDHRGGGGLLSCQDHTFDEIVPKNFEPGSLGGFYSNSEVIDQLDIMAFMFPDLISVRRPVGNIKTWEGNNIYWVRISDHAETDENEPEILYTGLHHAREFISVSSNIYLMWYLLENYAKDPVVRQILDHTELYFIPVVNPDGLEYNADGYEPSTGEFTNNLRKNMRDNNLDGVFDPEIDGVDLNRNYGYQWAYDDDGSSGYEGSINYRGPYPFSEPETQAVKLLCEQHHFKLALNYHSYGNLLIYPWGYNNTNTLDSVLFQNYAELLTKLNGYVYGLGEETVGYVTNGDSDDWMYAEQDILAMTPEVGDPDDGFYPVPDRIIPLCQSTLQMNLLAARLVNSLVQITDESPRYIKSGDNAMDLEFNRYGLLDGEVVISFHAISPSIIKMPDPIILDMDKFEPHERHLSFRVDNAIPYGSSIKFEIVTQQGEYTFRDTIVKTRVDYTTIVSDNGNDLSKWDNTQSTSWGVTKQEFKSGPVSIADSPAGEYEPNSHDPLVLLQQVDLTKAVSAYAQFWARWDIEDSYDYVVFQASTDGENWSNLCGEQSRLGSIFQLYEEPLYDGKQTRWVLETTDLSAYKGQVIHLRFLLVSDGFVMKDGFYFDDFKIITLDENQVGTKDIAQQSLKVYPNPAYKSFSLSIPELTNAKMIMYNSLGEPVYRSPVESNQLHQVNVAGWAPGLYYFAVEADGRSVYYGSVSVQP